MSMSQPLEPRPDALHRPGDEQTIPAADPGAGAPDTTTGFGLAGEEPDVPEDADPRAGGRDAELPQDTPFRTPDPGDVGPEGTR